MLTFSSPIWTNSLGTRQWSSKILFPQLQAEVQRLEELKLLNIRNVTDAIRSEIAVFWEKCFFSTDQRQAFAPYFSGGFTLFDILNRTMSAFGKVLKLLTLFRGFYRRAAESAWCRDPALEAALWGSQRTFWRSSAVGRKLETLPGAGGESDGGRKSTPIVNETKVATKLSRPKMCLNFTISLWFIWGNALMVYLYHFII